MTDSEKMFTRDLPMAYLILRMIMAVNMIPHGGQRFAFLDQFASGVADQFVEVTFWGLYILPPSITYPYAIALAIVEFVIGLCLLFGFKTRLAAITGGFMMVTLMFGKLVKLEFGAASNMFIYTFVFAALVALHRFDKYSVDQRLSSR